ncbi:MAG: chromate efflux transporter [Actinomycetota bacterium]
MSRPSLGELARLFLKIGVVAFGGPAAHIAMMHDEIVRRRRWMDEQAFLDRLGVTNLIPGPNSTELAILVGGALGRGWGLVVAGVAFIVPAAVIVLALAWVYVRYGATPEAGSLLFGIKPVIIAIVAQALFSLGRRAAGAPLTAAVFVTAGAVYLLGVDEIVVLVSGGLIVMATRLARPVQMRALMVPVGLSGSVWAQAARSEVDLTTLFLVFLKIGSVLYGGGYVLLAFLRTDLVENLGWLSNDQLLDAVAIGQVTPGPLFTTATFVGYVVARVPGALLATAGIFLPSFLLVALIGPFAERLRRSQVMGALLDGVNAAALGLMAGVTVELARSAIVDGYTAALAALSLVILVRFRLNSAWLVAGGAAAGVALAGLR